MNRFVGSGGKTRLIKALQSQSVVRGDTNVALLLSGKVKLLEYPIGSTLIVQDSVDDAIHFILSGRVAIRVNDRDIAIRTAGTHVGEMAVIDPGARRSASVVAIEPTVTALMSAGDFCAIADQCPTMWHRTAVELGNRLRERNRYVSPPNSIPVVFVGSSKESIQILDSLVAKLKESKSIELVPWNGDLFWPSNATIEYLEKQLPRTDFAILIFGPDDKVTSRRITSMGPRDNVLLECGMFFGAIGRKRTYFLKPKDVTIKMPSDLYGLKSIDYDIASGKADVSEACSEIMRCIERYGPK